MLSGLHGLLVVVVTAGILGGRSVQAKTLYLSECTGTDAQRWVYRPGPFVHNTLIRLIAAPDWCMVHYIAAQQANQSLYADLCDIPEPTPLDYSARIWVMINGTIRVAGDEYCLAANVSGDQGNLWLVQCNQSVHTAVAAGAVAEDLAMTITWQWNETGLIMPLGTTPPLCVTVNMSSPTPPHHGGFPDDFNVMSAKCDTTDKLQRWSGYPESNGTIHHMANTSYCLAAHGLYPGTHGPNVVISPCNESDITQHYSHNNKTNTICATTEMKCGGTNITQCCINIGHTTTTPEPGNNIELYSNMDDPTEEWTYDPTTQQLKAAGLCMTIVK
eukprot:scpid6404/ scgid5338/ 